MQEILRLHVKCTKCSHEVDGKTFPGFKATERVTYTCPKCHSPMMARTYLEEPENAHI